MILKIKNTSQKLFQEAITTLPTASERAEILFLVEGLHKDNLKDADEYLKRGIIPFSIATIKYYSDDKSFEISRVQIKSDPEYTIRGGKIGHMRISISSPDGDGFEMFKKSYLRLLNKNGYQLESGLLWLAYRTVGSHHERGEIPLSTLSFDRNESIKGLELMLGGEDRELLTEWFNGLKAKYR